MFFLSQGCGLQFNNPNANSTSSSGVTHGGWKDVFSIGPKIETDGTTTQNETGYTASSRRCNGTSHCIYIEWNDFTPTSDLGSISSYRVYQSTSLSGTYSLVQDSTEKNFRLSSPTASTVYYFEVRVVIDGVEYASSRSDKILHVIAPPANMALIHRWIANQEVCGLMQKDTDPSNNYRCEYNGLASIQDGSTWYYDFGRGLDTRLGDFLFDRFELGSDGGTPVNAPHSAGNSVSAFTSINQATANTHCATMSATVTGYTNSPYTKRLSRRFEWVAAAAWDTEYTLFDSAAKIEAIEDGTTGGVNDCNTASAGGGRNPGQSTRDECVSRYGLQDMIGANWEWNTDQLSCSGGTCSAGFSDHPTDSVAFVPSLDIANREYLRNSDGMYYNEHSSNSIGGHQSTNPQALIAFPFYNVAIGMRIDCSGTACASGTDDNTLITGQATGANIVNFPLHGDSSWRTNGTVANFSGGGEFATPAAAAGRWTVDYNNAPNLTAGGFGARCGALIN